LFYKSGQVANLYGVTTETLRSWSKDFSTYLSPSAQAGKNKQRLYSNEDLTIISLVAELRKENLTYQEIHLALKNGQRGQPPALNPDELRELQKQAKQETDPETLQNLLVRTQDTLEVVQRQLYELQEIKERNIELTTSLSHVTDERDRLQKQTTQLNKKVEQLTRELGKEYNQGFKDGLKHEKT